MISSLPRAFALLVLLSTAQGADWPQWRGPQRTGHAPAGVPVPKTLPAELKILWRTKLGDGLASPVVAGGKIFYLDNQQGKETLHAAQAADGSVLWSEAIDDSFKDSQSPAGPRCTPLANDGRVYAQSCRGELQCRDAVSGKLVWRTSFVTNLGAVFTGEKGQSAGAVRHGYDGSPLIDDGHLIATVGGTTGASVVCFDKATGKMIWKSQNDTASYAPPIIETIAGRRQIVAFTVEGLIGLDPRDGALLWRVPFKTTFGRHVTTPVVVEDLVCIASHEFGLVATRITPDGGQFKAATVWTNKEAAINFSSPVAVGVHLYGVGPAKNLICVEAKTGRIAWSKDGYFTSAAGKAHAGFLVLGDSILASTVGGQLVLFAADPGEFRERGRAQVCGNNWSNPAYADGQLFLRDAKELLGVALLP